MTKRYDGIEVTPEEAIEYLGYIIDTLGLSFFANPKSFPALRQCFQRGWAAASSGWKNTSATYAAKKARNGFVGNGVVSGATKALMTLDEGAVFRVGQRGISLFGQPLSASQLRDRKKMGGGLPGYAVGKYPQRANHPAKSAHSRESSTGRSETMDNRISSTYKFGSFLTLDVIAPDLVLPQVATYQDALRALPIPPATLKRVRKKGLYYTVKGGKARRTK